MEVYKVTFDRDYRTVTDHGYISSPKDVEDDWTGYSYSYWTDHTMKKRLEADEARRLLKQ